MTPAQLANDKFVRAAARVVLACNLEAPNEIAYWRRDLRIERAQRLKRIRWVQLQAALESNREAQSPFDDPQYIAECLYDAGGGA